MREVKFRGKSLKTNEWVYGFYYRHDPPLQCIGESDEKAIHYIVKTGFADWNMPRDIELNEINIETLGKYIGLKDCENKEVYEDDLLEDAGNNIFIVRFGEYTQITYLGGFKRVKSKEYGFYLEKVKTNEKVSAIEIVYLKLIGNIYENPDLLEEV